MLPKNNKKRRKKNQISNPAISNGENEKKIQKKRKKVKPAEPVTRKHVSVRGFIPVVSNGGNEENDKKKANKNKKWVILGNKSDRGSDLKFF